MRPATPFMIHHNLQRRYTCTAGAVHSVLVASEYQTEVVRCRHYPIHHAGVDRMLGRHPLVSPPSRPPHVTPQ